jgi:hypothetical protein
MTPEQIRAAIAARPDLSAVTDSQAIADALSKDRKRRVTPTYIGHGTLADVIGMPLGPVAVRTIRLMAEAPLADTAPAAQTAEKALVEQAWLLLKEGKLDVSLESVRSGMDLMVGKVPGFTAATVAKIKALAEVDDPVTAKQVQDAIEGA